MIYFLIILYFSIISTQIPKTNVSFVIFDDSLSQVSDWSWGVHPVISSSNVKSGNSSILAAFLSNTGQWAGLYLNFNSAVSTTNVQSLELDINPNVVPKLRLCFRDPKAVQYCSDSFASNAKTNTYTHYSLPISFFTGNYIQSIIFQTTDDSYAQNIYLDSIYLSTKGSSSTTTTNSTSNSTVQPNPTPISCMKNATPPIKSKGSIPISLPDRFLVGLFQDDPNPTWMKDSKVPWDVEYIYLTKGWVNNWGWGSYDGTFAYNFFIKTNSDGFIPSVQYYQIVGEGPWPNDESKFIAKLQNNSTMTSYFKDFIIFMKQVKNYGKAVMILMEADGFAYCQIQSNNNGNLYAAIADTGIPELQGLPNTVYGFGLALLKIRKAIGATNGYLGIHVSGWASSKDLFYFSVTDPLQPEIDKIYNFLLPFGLTKNNVVGEEFDFLVTDPLDRDSDFYRVTQNQMRWWNASDAASINSTSFNRHIEYLKLFNQKSSKKWILWQIPVGNSNSKNVPNSNKNVAGEGYKDNRAEYFFGDNGLGLCHCRKYAEAGVYALLFGRGEGQQSNFVNDAYTDGQLFMKTRVKKNYYDLGGLALNRTSS